MGKKSKFDPLSQAFKDIRAFGVYSSVKAMLRKFGKGTLALNIRDFGSITISRGDSDYATIRQTFRDREYFVQNEIVMRHLSCRFTEIINGGGVPVIVDAGANIGVASIWFSNQFRNASVVAIEPDSENVAILRKNCSNNNDITVMEAAVGANGGFVEVINTGQSWSVTTERSDSGVPVITIDRAVKLIPNGVPFIIKIDIEGFESDVFESNIDWINRTTAIFLEPHDWKFTGKGTSRSFQRAMGARDFEIFISGENLLYANLTNLN